MWAPAYLTAQRLPYHIHGEDLYECPRSFITRESKLITEIFANADAVREQTGQSPMGDLKEWPGRMIDAAAVVQVSKSRIEYERDRAEQANRPNR